VERTRTRFPARNRVVETFDSPGRRGGTATSCRHAQRIEIDRVQEVYWVYTAFAIVSEPTARRHYKMLVNSGFTETEPDDQTTLIKSLEID
jgi:hypothetical protein